MRLKKWVCAGIVILLFLGIGLMGLGFLLPYHLAQTQMPDVGWPTLEAQSDGSWLLFWPAAENADLYRVELYRADQPEPLYRNFTQGEPQILLPQIPDDEVFTLRITPGAQFRTIREQSIRYAQQPLEVQVRFQIPAIASYSLSIDGDDKTASLTVEKSGDTQLQYTLLDSSGAVLDGQRTQDDAVVFQFGDGGLPMPDLDKHCLLRICGVRQEPGILLYGPTLEDETITGESLQYKKLDPVLTETSKNTIQITWEETRGDHYEVQKLEGDGWATVATVSMDSPRTFTEWVEPGVTNQYRVVAADTHGEYPVISETLEFTGKNMVRYATVWPTRNLAAVSRPHTENIVAFAQEGQAYCVLDEVDGMFAIQIGDELCYIDSNYCFINLPEYIGGLCNYNITNSVSSIYAVHDFPIPNVTGVVTVGYEDVAQEDGSHLVPLLYPTARKLVKAAKAAREQGYRLKIYDSFRPYVATREVYDLTREVLNTPLPDETYTGIPKSSLTLPDPRPGQEELTLGWLMTGPNYDLRSFLARDGSAHNLGIAMDLTLEDLSTGQELPMQTLIHDLSHYSVLLENNDMANTLQSIMLGAGFTELASEWWHFQDNKAKEDLGLNPVLNGVSAECWVKDDFGWKYRTANGHFYAGETTEVSGTSYTFDEQGYVAQ